MENVEIGFKYHNGTAEVPVMGRSKDIILAFSILTACLARSTGVPIGVLIAAAAEGDKSYDKIVGSCITIDRDELLRQRGREGG